ncbi:MAG: RhuM family protein [Marinobacter sp.]
MTDLFDRDKSVISRHIGNVFKEGELDRSAVVGKNATTAADGKTYQVDYFNLNVIISVGYRVKSKRGVQFRQWATGVLKDHLVQGYDEQQLTEVGIKQPGMQPLELNEAVEASGELKRTLIAKGEATELFGQLRGDGLTSALATIEQGFGDELCYPNIATRAAYPAFTMRQKDL